MHHAALTSALLTGAALAGAAAQRLGLPLPFLMGPLILSAALSAWTPRSYEFPPRLRLVFIGLIGVTIGLQVSPALFARIPELAPSFGLIAVFVALALTMNYAIYRRIGGYDRATAFHAATPGGLYESLAFGQEAGGDPARLVLQQFLRVILVVTFLPLGLSIWMGAPVGSAGGMSLAQPDVPLIHLPLIALICALGIAAGLILKLPARQLTGPMLAGGIVALSGVMTLDIPQWLVNVAQIVVGTALGARFGGLSRTLILRGIGLSLLSVSGMLAMAAGFALALVQITGEAFDVLLISFAPGGVTEMALVALSIEASPALVTLHHIWRILLTVIGLSVLSKRFRTPL